MWTFLAENRRNLSEMGVGFLVRGREKERDEERMEKRGGEGAHDNR